MLRCSELCSWWHDVSKFMLLNEFGSVYLPCCQLPIYSPLLVSYRELEICKICCNLAFEIIDEWYIFYHYAVNQFLYACTVIMYRTRARSQLIQQRNLEFNLGGPAKKQRGSIAYLHPITGWLPILTRAKQIKSLERNERITLRQVTRIYHWFRSIQLHFIISKLIWSVHVTYQKCFIFVFQIWIFDEMRDSHNVSKIGLIFSALSKSACGGLVPQVHHFVQPWQIYFKTSLGAPQIACSVDWMCIYFYD